MALRRIIDNAVLSAVQSVAGFKRGRFDGGAWPCPSWPDPASRASFGVMAEVSRCVQKFAGAPAIMPCNRLESAALPEPAARR